MDWDASFSLNIVVGGGGSDIAKKAAQKMQRSKYDKCLAATSRRAKKGSVALTAVLAQ
jgi:hypothetical protein